MTGHFADTPHEYDVDTDDRKPIAADPHVDPEDDVAEPGDDDFRDATATEQDELDELDEAHREVD